jgi:Zn-finger nucleic acid-binding protein
MDVRCACGAAWLADDKLISMARDAAGVLVKLPWQDRTGAPRPCPVCTTNMLTVSIEDVALDRCPTHGVWFDPEELQKVLARAPNFPERHTATAANTRSRGAAAETATVLGAILDIFSIFS